MATSDPFPLVERLAERLFLKMEHLDPSFRPGGWAGLTNREREFFRLSVEDLLQDRWLAGVPKDGPAKGRVYVTATGSTGSGKSAVLGEIEIAMKAIGVPVEHGPDFQAEKNMTHADWETALDLYKPTVVLIEVNIPGAAPVKP